jgi:hypothetical protein
MWVFISGPRDAIERRLGFAWRHAPDDVPNGRSLLVFTVGRDVVASSMYPWADGSFACEAYPHGFRSVDAIFRVHLSSTSFADPPIPILTRSHQRAGERKCLSVYGAA